MKAMVLVVLAAGCSMMAVLGGEVTQIKPQAAAPAVPAPVLPATNSARQKAATPEESADYAAIAREELLLGAERNLLTRLAEEHLERAEQLANEGKSEKAQWETDLANEFKSRSTALLGRLNQLTGERLAFEKAHAPVAPTPSSAPGDRRKLNPDEFVYVTKVDERLLKVRQEIAAWEENARNLQSELQTNHSEEAVERISALIEANNSRLMQSEKEQAELELRKLEFRALRK